MSSTRHFIVHEAHDLADQLQRLLRHHPHLRAKSIHARVVNDVVLLSGTVRSYYKKQMAQEAMRAEIGMDRVVNNIVVESKRR